MESYIAKTSFKVGLNSEESVEVTEKDVVKFDGHKAEINGTEYDVPKFDSAISAGWVEPLEDYKRKRKSGQEGSQPQAPSAEIELSPADGEGESTVSDGQVEVADEERVVTKVDERDELREEMERQREENNNQEDDEQKTAGPQDGQVVAEGFESSTRSNTTLEGRNASKHGINRKIQDTKSAVKRKNKVSKQETEASTGAQPMENPGDIPRTSSTPTPEPETKKQAENVEKSGEVGGVEKDNKLDPDTKQGRYETVKAANPNLPEFNFSQHWASRMKELRDNHSDNHAMIRAVYAAESEKIKQRIKEEFPEAFQG